MWSFHSARIRSPHWWPTLSPDFYVDEDAVRRAVRAHSTANVIHIATMLKVDIFVAGGTPLDEEQLARRLWVRVVESAAATSALTWSKVRGGASSALDLEHPRVQLRIHSNVADVKFFPR
jgi:hypothetical protein